MQGLAQREGTSVAVQQHKPGDREDAGNGARTGAAPSGPSPTRQALDRLIRHAPGQRLREIRSALHDHQNSDDGALTALVPAPIVLSAMDIYFLEQHIDARLQHLRSRRHAPTPAADTAANPSEAPAPSPAPSPSLAPTPAPAPSPALTPAPAPALTPTNAPNELVPQAALDDGRRAAEASRQFDRQLPAVEAVLQRMRPIEAALLRADLQRMRAWAMRYARGPNAVGEPNQVGATVEDGALRTLSRGSRVGTQDDSKVVVDLEIQIVDGNVQLHLGANELGPHTLLVLLGRYSAVPRRQGAADTELSTGALLRSLHTLNGR